MNSVQQLIDAKLQEREGLGSLRALSFAGGLADFTSNDYLGFARSAILREAIEAELRRHGDWAVGAGGSRLLSGNDRYTEELEAWIADFHHADAGLLFNSGYDANIGLFSSLLQRGDTVLHDELIHASVIDGIRLGFGIRQSFRHNDLEHLEQQLKRATGRTIIAVESIYSMDGDEAPLREIAALAGNYGAALIVDEAHATGIFGHQGKGLVHHLGLTHAVFARVITFGKALGCHGAIVLGNTTLRDYLINFARPFIYSTAAPFYAHVAIRMAYEHLQQRDHAAALRTRISLFNAVTAPIREKFIAANSAIQSLPVGGNDPTRQIARRLRAEGFDVRAILHPTVAEGSERLRICLHTFNSDNEITQLAALLNQLSA